MMPGQLTSMPWTILPSYSGVLPVFKTFWPGRDRSDQILRGGDKTGLGDLRSAVSAGSETRAEPFCYRLLVLVGLDVGPRGRSARVGAPGL